MTLLTRILRKATYRSLSEVLYSLAAWRQRMSSPRVLLSANPRKSFSLHCVEDMLWKILALSVWQQWGLSKRGPHSWLWKYDVVSRCIWGCTSPPFHLKCIQTTSYWELHYAAQGNTSSLWLHHGSLCRLCLCGFFLSFYYTVQWVTGNAPLLSLEDHQDWTARVLSSASTPYSSCWHLFSLLQEFCGEHTVY